MRSAWSPRDLRGTDAPSQRSLQRMPQSHPTMKLTRALLVALCLASLGSALAQPANDNFANRFTLNGLVATTNGTTVGATRETGEPTIGNDGNQTVWYEWVAPYQVLTTVR